MGPTLVQWASHATWSAPRRAACIGISQQWRAYLTDGNSVTQAQVTSIKKNFIDLTVLAGDRNSLLVAGALLRQPIRLSYASGGTSGHSRTRDVRFWHLADMLNAPTNGGLVSLDGSRATMNCIRQRNGPRGELTSGLHSLDPRR
jgi:hypothetical protein